MFQDENLSKVQCQRVTRKSQALTNPAYACRRESLVHAKISAHHSQGVTLFLQLALMEWERKARKALVSQSLSTSCGLLRWPSQGQATGLRWPPQGQATSGQNVSLIHFLINIFLVACCKMSI